MNNKRIKLFGGFILLCLIIYIGATFFFNERNNSDMIPVKVYFLNPATNMIEPEERMIPTGENKDMAGMVLNMMFEGPQNKNLSKVIPKNVRILEDPRLISNTKVFELEFSTEYNEMDKLSEVYFRAAFVWTMTSLDFINDVHFYVDGQELLNSSGNPLGLLNRNNVLLNPTLTHEKLQTLLVKLYYADEEEQNLVMEERYINYNSTKKDVEKYIVEQLIKGPEMSDHHPTIPSETKIREIITYEGTCYVNLSSDFISRHVGGSAMEKLTVYSIVNSLTELSNVTKVQFLIEYVSVSDFKGTVDLSKVFERNEDLIK